MLPWQLECQPNQFKKLMQPIFLPDDVIHDLITIYRLNSEIYFFENLNGQ